MPDWYEVKRARLEKRLALLYKEAHKDLEKKVKQYYWGWNEDIDGKEVHHAGMYERYLEQFHAFEAGQYHDESGRYTDRQMFDRWVYAQEGRGKYWISMRDQMADRLTQANQIATAYINGETPKVWRRASNETAAMAQKAAMKQGKLGYRFDLIDESTLKAIMKDKNRILPVSKNVNVEKDKVWNREKLQNALYNAVLRGEDLEKLADSFQAVTNMNRSAAIRNARTALTNAKCTGTQDRYNELAEKGCIATKVWEDIHDSMPPERPEHWDASGQEVPYDEPFIVGGEELMYPGDPAGSGWNIYNCRCRMRTGGFRFVSKLNNDQRERANIRVY